MRWQRLAEDDDDALPVPLARRIVKLDRIRPGPAGAVTGAIGAASMVLATSGVVMSLRGADAWAFASVLAAPFRDFAPPWPTVMGIGFFVVAGSVVGALFASLTRRLTKFW